MRFSPWIWFKLSNEILKWMLLLMSPCCLSKILKKENICLYVQVVSNNNFSLIVNENSYLDWDSSQPQKKNSFYEESTACTAMRHLLTTNRKTTFACDLNRLHLTAHDMQLHIATDVTVRSHFATISKIQLSFNGILLL